MKKAIIAILFVCVTLPAFAKENEKIYGSTFPATFMLYIISPDLIIGWNGPLRPHEIKYIPDKYLKLPDVGGWYGQGSVPDKEVLMREGIKKALVLVSGSKRDEEAVKTLTDLGIEVIQVKALTMNDYVEAFRTIGKATGTTERTEELASYAEKALIKSAEMMKGFDEKKRLKIYFAQGTDGLETVCAGTYREEALLLAGGRNVQQCEISQDFARVSFEQLMRLDPDVILVHAGEFGTKYMEDPKWQVLRAVKAGNVYRVPYEPFNWLDRPPSYMRFVGLQWLICTLHKDRCTVDIREETGRFMETYFRVKLVDAEIDSILLR